MIASEKLRAWLTDPGAMNSTTRAMEDFATAPTALRALDLLKAGVDQAEAAGADAVLELARAFLERADFRECLSTAVDAAARDPFFRPFFRPSTGAVHSGLILFSHPALSVMLAVMSAESLATKRAFREGPASIIFTGQRSIYRFLDPDGTLLSFWRAPESDDSFSAAAAGRCALVERRLVHADEIVDVDGRTSSFIIDHAPRDVPYVQAFTPLGSSAVSREYDSATLELVGTSGTDDASSRMRMMLALLRIMDRQDAVPQFREAVRSPYFYARWEAMRELLALNCEAALPDLEAMSESDPHPEVRAAARQTLALLEATSAREPEPCLS